MSFKSINDSFLLRRQINNSINSIPKKNRHKFYIDVLKLIELAHEDDYENLSF